MAISTKAQYSKTSWSNGGGQPIDDRNLNKIEKGLADVVTAVNTNADALDDLSETVKNKFQQLDSNNEDVDSKLSEYDSSLADIDEEIDSIQEEISDIESEIDVITESISNIGEQITEEKANIDSTIKAEIERAKAAEQELSDAINAEKEKLDAFLSSGDVDSALDSLKEIQDFITGEASAADELVSKVSEIESEVDRKADKDAVTIINATAIFASDKVVIDCGLLG